MKNFVNVNNLYIGRVCEVSAGNASLESVPSVSELKFAFVKKGNRYFEVNSGQKYLAEFPSEKNFLSYLFGSSYVIIDFKFEDYYTDYEYTNISIEELNDRISSLNSSEKATLRKLK